MANSTTNISSYFNRMMDNLQKRAEVVVGKLWRETLSDYIVIAKKRLEKEFNEAIQEFYDDYTPTVYHRHMSAKRHTAGSLYDIFETEIIDDTNGLHTDLEYWYDPDKMTGFGQDRKDSDTPVFRGEGGLYDQVFRKGWHGGAGSINGAKVAKYGEHPSPGTPYWRYPTPSFTKWGDSSRGRAPIAKISPLDNMKKRIKNYEDKEIEGELEAILTKKFKALGFYWWR